jgi:hypothetical protein
MRTRVTIAALGLAAIGLLGAAGAPAMAVDRDADSGRLALLRGSLHKPCLGLPVKADVGSLVGVVPVSVHDIPFPSDSEIQPCTENSTQAKGDTTLANALRDLSLLAPVDD